MNNETKTAIGKVLKPKQVSEASSKLSSGMYEIDEIVRLTGTITKGEDYEQTVAMSVPVWKLLAVTLSKLNNETVDSIVRKADEISDEQEKEIKEKAQEALTKIKGKAKKVCAGKVTTDLAIEIVQSVGDKVEAEKVEAAEDTVEA
jgi:Glu-tRNA(Gln) amidotransferase subunit E-like FAD-binding protein